jgi:pimeloyl-ACP methyl ester carboxylesterase
MSTSASSSAGGVTAAERAQIQRANISGLQPVVFVHGLWLLPESWASWAEAFEEAGYIALTPGWPDDPASVAEANANPGVMAGKTLGQVVDHFCTVISQLERKPAVIGHSFGGLLAQILAGRGQSHVTVAMAPAPFRGVLPLPLSALKASWPVLGSLSNRRRAIGLTYEQFRFAFANAVSEDEARALFAGHAVPAPGAPLFQAATANLNPWTEAQVDTLNQERGPLLVVAGQKDNTVPWAMANAAYRQQLLNPGHTEIVEIPGRGHSLVIDSGWREVCDTALAFVRRFAAPDAYDSAYLDYVDTPIREDEDRRVTVF